MVLSANVSGAALDIDRSSIPLSNLHDEVAYLTYTVPALQLSFWNTEAVEEPFLIASCATNISITGPRQILKSKPPLRSLSITTPSSVLSVTSIGYVHGAILHAVDQEQLRSYIFSSPVSYEHTDVETSDVCRSGRPWP